MKEGENISESPVDITPLEQTIHLGPSNTDVYRNWGTALAGLGQSEVPGESSPSGSSIQESSDGIRRRFEQIGRIIEAGAEES